MVRWRCLAQRQENYPDILSISWSLPTYKVSLSDENLSRWLCMCKSKKIQLIPQALFYDPYSTLPLCYEKNILWPHKLARATSCIKPEGLLLAKLLRVFNTIMSTDYVNLPQEKRDATFFKLIKTHLSFFPLWNTKSPPWFSREHSLSNSVIEGKKNISFSSKNMSVKKKKTAVVKLPIAQKESRNHILLT